MSHDETASVCHIINPNVGSSNVEECKRNLIITNKDCFKWFGEFGALQMLFNDILKSEISWSKPGGSCRKLEVDQLTVRWYSDNHSLTINGSKDEEIKSCLRDLAKEVVDHEDTVNTSESCIEIQNNESIDSTNFDGADKSLDCGAHVLPQIYEEDLMKIKKNIEKIEKKLECKLNDISFEVCKLKEEDSLGQTMSREYIRSIKENNAQLKAENTTLKKELDCSTLVMSDLNLKIKMMEEEKRSLV